MATVSESVQTVKTYPFSDPDPVADPSDLFYPYFRFDGFAAKGVDKEWKVVALENDYIKLTLFPEIGGKIWGAVDKTSQKEFIYNNHVVKFRDIAMRGPWTSGGIEFNFGIIGHAPTSVHLSDYMTGRKPTGRRKLLCIFLRSGDPYALDCGSKPAEGQSLFYNKDNLA